MARTFAIAGILVASLAAGCAASRPAARPEAAAMCRCTPDKPCWPAQADWQRFGASLHGKLEQPQSPLAPCRSDAAGEACAAAIRNSKNPFYLQDQAGGTQSTGWLDAWSAASSAYAVAAEDSGDIVAAVDFARRYGLRLVIKGTGHDYLGRSNAPDSLLVWTHKMRRVSTHDAFLPSGCPATQAGSPAVSVEAGTRWLEAYQEVSVKHGRYVQGGGCTSVGAAGGFMQGGGFGSWSRKFGIAAASMLEAEVVTADGKLIVANACQNQDLFWALRGGGGGTYGIVTRVTLKTHPLPSYFGGIDGSIVAKSDAAFKELLERFLLFYRDRLNNEHWGEQVRVRRNNSLQISMVSQGLRASEINEVWQPLRDFVDRNPDSFTMKVNAYEVPGNRLWDTAFLKEHAPDAIQRDERAGEPGDRFWWAGDGEQVSAFWYAYQSRWVPVDREATPGTGSYVNETDYFEPDWQRSFWGENYQRLLEVKRKYDPEGLFYCHHCVGSENWSSDGMCRPH